MTHINTSKLNDKNEYLYNLIDRVKQRPGMYLGKTSITRFRMFLMGYSMARREMGLSLTEQEKEFGKFQGWVQKRFNITSTQGWDSIILFYSEDEKDALNTFFELFQEFLQGIKADSQSEINQELTSTATNLK